MAADTKNLKPRVRRLMEQLVKDAAKVGFEILITQGYRSIEEQNRLYAQGRQTKGNIVTNAKGGDSFHNHGCAFDYCFLVNKKASYSLPDSAWKKIADLGVKLGLEAGYYWKGFQDKPHFSFTTGYSLKDFKTGKIDPKKFI